MAQPFELGQRVRVLAQVETRYGGGHSGVMGWECVHRVTGADGKHLFRREVDMEGVVIGYTFRQTGKYRPASGYYYEADGDGAFLRADKTHKVWMVARTVRWASPVLCLEEDMRGVQDDC